MCCCPHPQHIACPAPCHRSGPDWRPHFLPAVHLVSHDALCSGWQPLVSRSHLQRAQLVDACCWPPGMGLGLSPIMHILPLSRTLLCRYPFRCSTALAGLASLAASVQRKCSGCSSQGGAGRGLPCSCLPGAPRAGEAAWPKLSLLADCFLPCRPSTNCCAGCTTGKWGGARLFVCYIVVARWLPCRGGSNGGAPCTKFASCFWVSTRGRHPLCARLSAFCATALQGVPPGPPRQVGHAGALGWGTAWLGSRPASAFGPALVALCSMSTLS